MSKWRGIFAPGTVKHRDGCGDITNHIEIKSISVNEKTQMVEVVVGFVGGEDVYTYEFPYDGNLDPERAMKEVVKQIGE